MEADATTTTTTTTTTTLEELYGGERFTEDHIVSAAILYHQGCFPPLHHLLSLPLTLTHTATPTTTLSRVMHWPLTLLLDLYGTCLQFLAVTLVRQGRKCVLAWSPFVLALMFVLFYVFGGRVDAFRHVVPVVVFCGSFVVMVTSSAGVLLNRRRMECVRMWSRVYSHFCSELDVGKAEARFKAGCWRPYAGLCVSLVVCVCVLPFVPHMLVVWSVPVMCVLGCVMLVLAVDQVALWHFVSVALYLMALSPEVPGVVGEALQDVGVGGWWVVGDTVKVGGGVNLHLGIGTVIHLLWLSLQVCVGVARGPAHLPPHLSGLIWTHLAVVAWRKVAVVQELVFPVVVWLVVWLVPAAASLSMVVIPAAVCVVVARLGATQEVVVLWLVLSCGVTFLCERVWPWVAGGVARVVVVCGVVVVMLKPSAIFTSPTLHTHTHTHSQHSPLQWNAYKNVCVPSNTLQAGSVHGCAPLLGTAVRWRGSVLQVNVVEIRNLPRKIISFLPSFLEVPVKCYLGDKPPECRPESAVDGIVYERCRTVIRTALGPGACSLHGWNEYQFEMKLAMEESYWKFGLGEGEVSVLADNTFTEFMLGVSAGDVVEFTATMTAGVGTAHLTLSLSAIKCVTCKLKASTVADSTTTTTTTTLDQAARHLFNFFLSPTLTV